MFFNVAGIQEFFFAWCSFERLIMHDSNVYIKLYAMMHVLLKLTEYIYIVKIEIKHFLS